MNDQTEHLPQPARGDIEKVRRERQRQANGPAIKLLESFLQGDEAEQTRAWEYLKAALDEDRPEHSMHFP